MLKKSNKPFTKIDSMRYTKTKTVNGQRMVYDSHNGDWLMWYVLFSDYSYPGDSNNIANDFCGSSDSSYSSSSSSDYSSSSSSSYDSGSSGSSS